MTDTQTQPKHYRTDTDLAHDVAVEIVTRRDVPSIAVGPFSGRGRGIEVFLKREEIEMMSPSELADIGSELQTFAKAENWGYYHQEGDNYHAITLVRRGKTRK